MADPDMLFDLNLHHADINEALSDFFHTADRAYVIEDPLEGEISVRVADVGFHDALVLILPTDFEALEVGGVYHIHHVDRPVEQRKF